jgi:serine/threonine-protein kinase SRPK3
MIASFLTPMLRLQADKRASARELAAHAWLDGVVVQGEIDVIRRAEETDAQRKQDAERAPRRSEDADAMKPVDEAGMLGGKVPMLSTPQPASARLKENALAHAVAATSTAGAPETTLRALPPPTIVPAKQAA